MSNKFIYLGKSDKNPLNPYTATNVIGTIYYFKCKRCNSILWTSNKEEPPQFCCKGGKK